jgi:hypothetical protein
MIFADQLNFAHLASGFRANPLLNTLELKSLVTSKHPANLTSRCTFMNGRPEVK